MSRFFMWSFQTPLGRLYPDDSEAKKELQSIIEQKLGKSIELHMLVAEDHQQTNLSQITVDQAIRDNIHMDVVIRRRLIFYQEDITMAKTWRISGHGKCGKHE